MADDVRDAYDAMAKQYAAFALGDLDRVPADRGCLAAFATLVVSKDATVADLGCGPGHIVNYLCGLGLEAIGYDISRSLVSEARCAFPDSHFFIGDLTALDVSDSVFGGIVARYSLIHLLPARLYDVFGEWLRVLESGAPIMVSFFASPRVDRHGSPFDHAVVTAYELFPATIVRQLQVSGFDIIKVSTRPRLDGERPLDHGTILARKPS